MLETYTTVLTDVSRNLYRNMRDSPILYLWFGLMMFFSVVMLAGLTFFMIEAEIEISLDDVFFTVFFVFLLKVSYDFHRHFIKSDAVSYSLSTPVKHSKTVFEIFLVIFWSNLGLWVLLSSLYSVTLIYLGINMGYPVEYLKFTFGVMLACVIGATVSLHFFSSKRYRLSPAVAMGASLYYFRDISSLIVILVIALCYLVWSLPKVLDSYQFVKRKERKKETMQLRVHNKIKAIFFKETTVLWRDGLLFSFIFTACFFGIVTGYLAEFGSETIIPEGLRVITENISPVMYGFIGIYIVIIYTSVFPGLNLFLIEEETIWIIRNLPLKGRSFVHGKAMALVLTFVCSIPFVAFFSAFTKGVDFVFLVWFLVFSFIAGMIIAMPLGAKYVGKKSDILLLYSVAMLVFVVLGVVMALQTFLLDSFLRFIFYFLSIICEIGILMISLELSSHILSLKYKIIS